MKIDQLLHFQETARFQHIGKASKSLNISAGAISHSIRCLEEELGQKLFQKQGKHISLTAHGKRLEQHADQVLAQIEKIKDDLRSEEALWEGDLRVGVTHKLLENVFVPAWSQFQKSHPNLRLEVYSQRSGQIVEQTQAGELDLGLCFNPLAHPLIKSKVIREQDLLISFRDTHPLTKMTKTQQLAHLSRFPCAAPKAFAGIEICENHPELKKFNIQCKEDFVFDSYEAAIARLQTTDSWCLLPELFVRQHSLAYLRPKGWAAKAKVCAIWNAKKNLSGALREFLHSLEL